MKVHRSGILILLWVVLAYSSAGASVPQAPVTDKVAQREINPEVVQKYWAAIRLLGSKDESEKAKARVLLKEAAEAEFPPAQNELGTCLVSGEAGFEKEAKKAVAQFRLASARGCPQASFNLGLCFMHGTGVRRDWNKAAECFELVVRSDADFSVAPPPSELSSTPAPNAVTPTVSGELGRDASEEIRARAHANLGLLYARSGDDGKAQLHDVAAAEAGEGGRAGVYEAAVRAAVRLAFGQGIPRDMSKANAMLEHSRKLSRRIASSLAHQLASRKLVDAFATEEFEQEFSKKAEATQRALWFGVAGSFADPKSKDYDLKEAIKWYELAAQSNDCWAMLNLAFIYVEGKLGSSDPTKAFTWFKAAAEKGHHLLGYANLAICYERGFGVVADHAKAVEIASANKDEDFVCYLVTIGQSPPGVVTYEQAVKIHLDWAKSRHEAHAQYLLGNRFWNGWGVETNKATAVSWYRKAAAQKHGLAMVALASACYDEYWYVSGASSDNHFERAAEYYKRAVDLGEASAAASLAFLYSEGWGVPKSEDKAVEYYERALQLDPKQTKALNNLGVWYEKRWKEAKAAGDAAALAESREKALRLYRTADEAGNGVSSYNLGMLSYEGKLVPRNYEEAYVLFERAASRGHEYARVRLGIMHEMGQGVPVTPEEAAYHYRLAALDGNLDALRRLCLYYLSPASGGRDLDRAAFWLLRLADTGDIEGLLAFVDILIDRGEYKQVRPILNEFADNKDPALRCFALQRLSRLYREGLGVEANPSKSDRLAKKAADQATPEVYYTLGVLLMKEAKKTEAAAMFERAADAVARAAYRLGCLYFSGDGVPKDTTKAWALFRQAAAKGDDEAQLNLAISTCTRVPGAPSVEEALTYAKQAEAKGLADADRVRKKLERMEADLSRPAGRSPGK